MNTNDKHVVLRTPYLNIHGEMSGCFEAFTTKNFVSSDLTISLIFLNADYTLVVLRTPHLNTHVELLGSFETFTIRNFKSSDFTISIIFYH